MATPGGSVCPPTMAGNPDNPCPTCDGIDAQGGFKFNVSATLEKIKKDKGELVKEFLKNVNALLNDRGGVVIIHCSNYEPLDGFDQKVDDRLNELIPDSSLFHEVFERSYYDERHVVYRVKLNPKRNRVGFSTMDYKSKMPMNKGRGVPTIHQMSTYIKSLYQNTQEMSEEELPAIDFLEDPNIEGPNAERFSHVYLRKRGGSEKFQERVNIQAKRFKADILQKIQGCCDQSVQMEEGEKKKRMDELVNYCWEKMSDYVVAFSKIRSGGVIYFGVEEKKIQNQPMYVVRAEGLPFNSKPEQDYVQTKLIEKARSQFKWHDIKNGIHTDTEPTMQDMLNILQINFIDVPGSHSQSFVIEVRINFFHGLCFNDKTGPEAYKATFTPSGVKNASFIQVPAQEWVQKFLSSGVGTGEGPEALGPPPF